MKPLLLGFADYRAAGQRLAQVAGLPYAEVKIHRFPDGESLVTLPTPLPPQVILCRSMEQPNDKLVELLLTLHQARQAGVERITLVAPYLCYMRQDTAFNPGEAVSQQAVSAFFDELLDELVTVDPHLHRVTDLNTLLSHCQARVVHATTAIAEFIGTTPALEGSLLVGPDEESEQWVSTLAEATGLDYAIAHKRRLGDHRVNITLPTLPKKQRNVLLVDDLLSSGGTLATAAAAALAAGAEAVDCIVTHALTIDAALPRLRQAGIRNLYSCDSVTHPSNRIELATLLAGALAPL